MLMVGAKPVLIVRYNGASTPWRPAVLAWAAVVLSEVRDRHIAMCPLHGSEFGALTGQMVKQPLVLLERPCEVRQVRQAAIQDLPPSGSTVTAS